LLLNIIILWYGNGTKLIVKEIKSLEGGSKAQRMHRDYVYKSNGSKETKRQFDRLFSVMIALETNQNPSRFIKHDGKDQILQQDKVLYGVVNIFMVVHCIRK
jgi:hypothetical protein